MEVYVIGTEYDVTQEPPVAKLGWRVNSSARLVGLDAFNVTPVTPSASFFGANTFYYVFDSEAQAKQLLNWRAETGFQPVFKAVKTVPVSVTRRQARQQLLIMGLLDQVEPTIAAIPDETARRMAEIYWQDATDFERDSTFLLSIAEALGLNADALDDAFIAAAKL